MSFDVKIARRALESRRDDPVDPLVIYCHLSGALNRIEALEAVVDAARPIKLSLNSASASWHIDKLHEALAKLDGREGET